MLELIQEGISSLQCITEVEESLKDYQRPWRTLCQRVRAFRPFLYNLQSGGHNNEKFVEITGFEDSLTHLVLLLRELNEYLSKDHAIDGDFTACCNAVFNNAEIKEIVLFNQRLNECSLILQITLSTTIEERQKQDLEDLKLGIVELSQEIIDGFTSTRKNSSALMQMTKDLKSVTTENNNANKALLDSINALQAKIADSNAILVSDIDFTFFRDTITQCIDEAVKGHQAEMKHVISCFSETQQMISELQNSTAIKDAEVSKQLNNLRMNLMRNQKVSGKEFKALTKRLQQLDSSHKGMLKSLEEKLDSLDILSIRKDLDQLHTTIESLKTLVDMNQKELISDLEEKLAKNQLVTTTELLKLRTALNGDNMDMMVLIESKLDALNLLSIEKKIDDLQHDVERVLRNEHDILETNVSILDGLHDLKTTQQEVLMLAKLLMDKKLSDRDKEIRDNMLKSLRLQPNELLFSNRKLLGQGGFGLVQLGVYKPSRNVAIKTLLSTRCTNMQNNIQAAENELLLMHYIGNHPNILTCYGYYIDAVTRDMHIVLEYAPYNSLSSILYNNEAFPHLSVRLVVGWLGDLINALKHVHSRKVKHRDVKAENLLVFADFSVKLCDFGLAKEHSSQRLPSLVSMAGTDGFKDPDPVVQAKGALYASDVFAWSMTAYQMLRRRFPTVNIALSTRVDNMIDDMKSDQEIQPKKYGMEMFERLLRRCADVDYTQRPLVSTVSEHLMTISAELGGDPRLQWNEGDMHYIMSLATAAKKHVQGIDTSASLSSSPVENTSIITRYNSAAESTNMDNASIVASNTLHHNTPQLVEFSMLTCEQAMQLLIHLGCCAELHEIVTAIGEKVDGEYLQGIDKVETLQYLENNYTDGRRPRLNNVLKKLQNIVSTQKSISRNTMDEIILRLQERGRLHNHKAEEQELKIEKAIETNNMRQEEDVPAASKAVLAEEQAKLGTQIEEKRHKVDNTSIRKALDRWYSDNGVALKSFGHVSNWDTSQVTDMKELFKGRKYFNEDISKWDVTNVTDMSYMFHEAFRFNQPLDSWNVNNVTDMSYMFSGASSFNQPLNSWNVSNVTNMRHMFHDALVFNQPLNSWNVRNVTDLSSFADGSSKFNQPLNEWDVANVVDIRNMFHEACSFNQPLNDWNVSKVINMYQVFKNAVQFNQPLNKWNVSSVTNMIGTFIGAYKFDQPLDSWNVSNVTIMNNLFINAYSFNQPLNNWNVSNVIQMKYMFHGAFSFNQPLNHWNVSKVTDMEGMFHNASNFNQPLDSWHVSNATNMKVMFDHATSFSYKESFQKNCLQKR